MLGVQPIVAIALVIMLNLIVVIDYFTGVNKTDVDSNVDQNNNDAFRINKSGMIYFFLAHSVFIPVNIFYSYIWLRLKRVQVQIVNIKVDDIIEEINKAIKYQKTYLILQFVFYILILIEFLVLIEVN